MFEQFLSFVLKYKAIIIFYLAVILFLVIKRKTIDVQAKIIFLYRMKWGLKWMDKYAAKYKEWVILIGYIATGVGFIGMIFISGYLIFELFYLFFVPKAATSVSLVLPGINIPGMGILPFWHWLIAIFIIAVTHEFSHGIVARANNIKVKNTGLVLFGPIIGAFVEPDEKKLRQKKDIEQYSVLAAGSFTNIMLAIVAVILLNSVFLPFHQAMDEPIGFSFDAYYQENFPAQLAGLPPGQVINKIDGKEINQFQDLSMMLNTKNPSEIITLTSGEEDYEITLAQDPEIEDKPYLGIQGIRNEFVVKEKYSVGAWNYLYLAIDKIVEFLGWFFLISFGIGLFNLLPLPIVDGGRMLQVFLQRLKGQEKGNAHYGRIGMFFLFILLILLVFPFLMKLF